jgi:hypothetical protein
MLRKVNDNIVREALETRTATCRTKEKGETPPQLENYSIRSKRRHTHRESENL